MFVSPNNFLYGRSFSSSILIGFKLAQLIYEFAIWYLHFI